MDLQLTDHIVVMTGAASGIGQATVRCARSRSKLANRGRPAVGDRLPCGLDMLGDSAPPIGQGQSRGQSRGQKGNANAQAFSPRRSA
jgi:NAD(P)-dependent dehydrogenase (short-subunit alcohol dehydrogenase family)